MITNKNEYVLFELYALEYKRLRIQKEYDKLYNIKSKIEKIDYELFHYIEKMCKLDIDIKKHQLDTPDPVTYYIENGRTINLHDYVKNLSWEGFWKKCSGKELEYFLSYMEYPIIKNNDSQYVKNDRNLIKLFQINTGINKIPYSISCTQYLNIKYFS